LRQTYAYFAEKFGEVMNKLDVSEVPTREAPPQQTVVVVPPHMGYGTEEDSLASLALQPKPPRKDWAKLKAYDGIVLRYHAVFAAPKSIPDETRK
jgi:hypothetical protein